MILAIALFVLLSITTFDNHFGIFKLFYSHCYITFEVSAEHPWCLNWFSSNISTPEVTLHSV